MIVGDFKEGELSYRDISVRPDASKTPIPSHDAINNKYQQQQQHTRTHKIFITYFGFHVQHSTLSDVFQSFNLSNSSEVDVLEEVIKRT